ncbi:MAG: YbaK/EbsC family protein [Alphaproteobacteria bacterium]|nr:YbaK/EbsC family protein [Alphaproteobacteria bacterium]
MTQSQALSKSAQNVQEFLSQKGLNFKVVELAESTRTADDAARAIGCEVAQICKSLIFKTKNTHKPVLVLASGINRVNEKIIETQVGEKIIKADADFTRDITGFVIGGIPPFAHKKSIDFILIDEDLLQFDEIWAAAGNPNAVFSLKGSDLKEITKGQIISIK